MKWNEILLELGTMMFTQNERKYIDLTGEPVKMDSLKLVITHRFTPSIQPKTIVL